MIFDISKLKQNETEQRLATSVFESSPNGIMVLDKDLTIVCVNSAFESITGYTKQDSIGKKAYFLRSARHSAQFYPEWLSIALINNGEQKEARYVGIFSDITAKKRS